MMEPISYPYAPVINKDSLFTLRSVNHTIHVKIEEYYS